MNKLYKGSIDLSKIDKARLYTHKDDRKFLNVAIWVNNNPNEPWQAVSIQQQTKKGEEKIYLGNAEEFKLVSADTTAPSNPPDDDDLPF